MGGEPQTAPSPPTESPEPTTATTLLGLSNPAELKSAADVFSWLEAYARALDNAQLERVNLERPEASDESITLESLNGELKVIWLTSACEESWEDPEEPEFMFEVNETSLSRGYYLLDGVVVATVQRNDHFFSNNEVPDCVDYEQADWTFLWRGQTVASWTDANTADCFGSVDDPDSVRYFNDEPKPEELDFVDDDRSTLLQREADILRTGETTSVRALPSCDAEKMEAPLPFESEELLINR